MDDAFYFTSQDIGLPDIALLADRLGMTTTLRSRGLVIVLGGGEYDHCHWAPFPLDDAEPEDAAALRQSGIRTGFCISHHPISRAALLPLLNSVLRAHGGWVGIDEGGFLPRFELANLDAFVSSPD